MARRLRDREETRLIPIVMVTAQGDLEPRVRGLESGADDYLAKPLNRTELLARVQSTLRLSYSELFLEVLVELVRNAIKFGGGKPVLVRVELRCRGERRLVSIADDGPGIPPEQLERIFERFYQVETDFTGQVHGVGLGLALVKTAVEAMGDRIQVQSQLGHGTRFEILL